MRETRADTAQAFVYAVALHALLFALMFVGLWWTRSSTPPESWGVPVEAEVIDASQLSASLRRALRQEAVKPEPPPPAPEEDALPEPLPEDQPPPPQPLAQERLPEPDAVDQEEVRADAVSPDTRLAGRRGGRYAPHTSPDPPGSSWSTMKRSYDTGSLRTPSRLAHQARPVR